MYSNSIKLIILLFASVIIVTFMHGCNDSSTGSGSSGSDWSFTDDGVDLNIAGVSPESILLTNGSVRLYVTDFGMKVYESSDGLTFELKTASFPPGSDPTLIELNDGTYRMYYVDGEEVSTAISADGLNWTEESNTGIINAGGSQAWGVPDSVELPDGSVRLYWVDEPEADDSFEVIKSAISTDGVSFTEEVGFRTQDGYVDPFILKAEEGDWVGLFSTTPDETRLPQQIYVGTSTDGLTWTIETEAIITVSGGNALDPTAVPLGDGSYRVYYSATEGTDPFSTFFLKSGILRSIVLTAKSRNPQILGRRS